MEVANLAPEVLMDSDGLDAGYDGDRKRNQYASSHLLTSIDSSRLAAFTIGRYQHLSPSPNGSEVKGLFVPWAASSAGLDI